MQLIVSQGLLSELHLSHFVLSGCWPGSQYASENMLDTCLKGSLYKLCSNSLKRSVLRWLEQGAGSLQLFHDSPSLRGWQEESCFTQKCVGKY